MKSLLRDVLEEFVCKEEQESFLKKIDSLLKDGGHILIVANNKIAINHLIGFPSINDYGFTKHELINLFREYSSVLFYYPYPNIYYDYLKKMLMIKKIIMTAPTS